MVKSHKVKITEGICFSKPNSKWLCSWCEKIIRPGEESLLMHGIDEGNSGQIYIKGFGARIHLNCLKSMCNKLKDAKEDREKYAILNSIERNQKI